MEGGGTAEAVVVREREAAGQGRGSSGRGVVSWRGERNRRCSRGSNGSRGSRGSREWDAPSLWPASRAWSCIAGGCVPLHRHGGAGERSAGEGEREEEAGWDD